MADLREENLIIQINDEDGILKTELLPASALIDTGLLWLINKVVFHPRGFAMAVDRYTNQWQLWGNGDEPWGFESKVNDEKFIMVEKFLECLRKR